MRAPLVLPQPIAGHRYRIDPMDALRQFDVVRRLAPLVSGAFVALVQALRAAGGDAAPAGETEDETRMRAGKALLQLLDKKGEDLAGPFLRALGGLSDADSRFIIMTCLSVTYRAAGDQWGPMVVNGQLMYQDMELPEMLQLVWEVIANQFLPFISARAQK